MCGPLRSGNGREVTRKADAGRRSRRAPLRRSGALDVEKMAHVVDLPLLDLRQPRAEARGDLHPESLGARAHHGERRLPYVLRLLFVETPLGEARELDTEEGLRVGDRLGDGPRELRL